MEPLVGVVVGVDAGVVGGKILHLVEAVLDRIGLGLVAQMPLAGEVRRIAVLLEELGDRRRLLAQGVLVARSDDDRESRADRNAPGHERGATRRAACLAVPTGEDRAFLGDLVDVRRRMAERGAAVRIGAEIVPAGVVGHQHDDVRSLLLRKSRRACHRHSGNRSQQGEVYFSARTHDLKPLLAARIRAGSLRPIYVCTATYRRNYETLFISCSF